VRAGCETLRPYRPPRRAGVYTLDGNLDRLPLEKPDTTESADEADPVLLELGHAVTPTLTEPILVTIDHPETALHLTAAPVTLSTSRRHARTLQPNRHRRS